MESGQYIAAFARVVRRFKDDSVVAGLVFNEPWIGWDLPPGFDPPSLSFL
jgi:hypothetical protein